MSKGSRVVCALVGLCVFLTANLAHAQPDSSITGIVKDSTGAVLPGVTIEVSSPALIERTRSALSDAGGQYRVIELVPGDYTVTFSLTGFAIVKREGIELTSGFTATVNAELRVGDIAETIVVSSASPIVDTQNVMQERVMTRDVIDTVPTDKNFANLTVLIPGMNTSAPDTGGSAGSQRQHLELHGGRSSDEYILVNGMSIGFSGTSGPSPMIFPDGSTGEINVETGAHSAELETGGVWVHIVPKSGSNHYTGTVFGSFTNHDLQANVLSPALEARGLLAADRVDYISDFNPAFGGPLIQNKLWFHIGYRNWQVARYSAVLYNTDPTGWTYTPDRSHSPVPNEELQQIGTANITWQATPRNRFTFNSDDGRTCECELFLAAGTTTLEAAARTLYPYKLEQVTWQSPASNHWLFDIGASGFLITHEVTPEPSAVGPPAIELTTGENFRSRSDSTAGNYNNPYTHVKWNNFTLQGSASYVTGAHHFKVGGIYNPKPEDMTKTDLSDYTLNLFNGAASSVIYSVLPLREITNIFSSGAYAQDEWTVGRMTLHGGLRLDGLYVDFPAVSEPATPLVAARNFPASGAIINRYDLSPRIGMAWDVFGTGKTAVKASLSKYLTSTNEDHGQAVAVNPEVSTAANATRSFTDKVGNFIPVGNPLNPAANGELGPSNNANFGSSVPTFALDPSWAKGFDKRQDQWETVVSVQQELMPRASATAAYIRRNYGNLTVTDNVAVSPSDFSQYCVTTPMDPRLPGAGGQQLCGLYDVTPSKVGAFSQVQTLASTYGKQYEYWQGADFSTSVRLGKGALLQGGVDVGRTITDNCDIVSRNPQLLGVGVPLSYCHAVQPFLPDYKFVGSYLFPANIEFSAAFQSHGGITSLFSTSFGVTANAVFTNAQIAPSLGRNLSTGPNSTVTVNLVPPGSVVADRLNQLDLRAAHTFTIGRTKWKGMVDLYNIFNNDPALTLNGTYGVTGATWLVPTSTLQGRLLKFGVLASF